MEDAKRFLIRTFGCQMNAHDSEKIANLLFHHGYRLADDLEDAQLLLVNTCSIREKAEHRLYSDLGTLRAWKAAAPQRLLAVGGCVAQQEGEALLHRFDHVDFVFGTHNLRRVPELAEEARRGRRALRIEESASLERFDLPERHPAYPGATPGRAYLTVMEGCDMFCSFCIVPTTRGREISRPAEGILAEARSLAARGVVELTLLGQTVNAYGRHDLRRGRAEQAGTMAFGELLRALAAIPGLRRLRYTSPHPLFFDEALIAAHGEVETVCPHVHLPLQSGSDRILEAMRRRYRARDYLRLVEQLRIARPDLAITSDLIVGFPGETEADFQATLDVVREADLVDSFSFKYSARPGTHAADLADAVPVEEAQRRLEALQELQRRLTLGHSTRRVGERTEILVEGPSRHPGQLQGRDPYHRVVNLLGPGRARPGEFLEVQIVGASPHSLLARLRATKPAEPLKPSPGLADEQVRAREAPAGG
ncbi:MAG: tRNA (N6-isopentenyl adenosine(37)-C2)-methylthiotransferase MiaB [Myxococcota bacterium]